MSMFRELLLYLNFFLFVEFLYVMADSVHGNTMMVCGVIRNATAGNARLTSGSVTFTVPAERRHETYSPTVLSA